MRDTRNRREHYGTDAVYVPAAYAAVAVVLAVVAVLDGPWWWIGTAVAGLGAACYLHASRRGKFVTWERLLDGLDLRGDEHVLDVGCGRGAVTVAAARRVPHGHVTGIDLWRRGDQTGNGPDAARANLAAAGVDDRVEVRTGDMRDLPFPDGSFDLVVSGLAVHNLGDRADRDRALDEMCRVLRPDGRLLLVDLKHTAQYVEHLRRDGADATRTGLGPRTWWSGPWAPTHAVRFTRTG